MTELQKIIKEVFTEFEYDDEHFIITPKVIELEKLLLDKVGQIEPLVMRKPTEIKDRHGNMIYFGDKVRFADKVEWYRGEYWVDVMVGSKTRKEALAEIEQRPYEERTVESVQDYEWLLSDEIQIYWELSA